MLMTLATKSLVNRKGSVLLTILSLVVSLALLLSVEQIRHQAKESFNRTVSGVDLIVGPRTGQLNLLLYAVFRVGNPSNNISWESYQSIASSPQVMWSVPIALGDSHRGFRVMGTTNDYFRFFQYGRKQALAFDQGDVLKDDFSVVLGADVAATFGYAVGDELVLSHGVGDVSFTHHDDSPFRVSGILARTGTPVDKTLHISLAGLNLMHMGEKQKHHAISHADEHPLHEAPITAFLLGLKSRIAVLQLQRSINEYTGEPLQSVLPGVALAELWQLVGTIETVLQVIAYLVLASSLLGLSTMLLASMRERQREMAVLRAVGAGPFTVFLLIQMESLLISASAIIIASVLVWTGTAFAAPWLSANYGLFIEAQFLSAESLTIAGYALLASLVISCIPAIGAYRQALQTSMSANN